MTDIPQNTVVVLPKPLPMNRGALWTLFWSIGLLMGLFVDNVIGIDQARPVATQGPQPEARVVIEFPTSTVTPTRTATAIPIAETRSTPALDLCQPGTTKPDQLCAVPAPPAPTASPYPSCDEPGLVYGDVCRWPQGTAITMEISS